MTGMQFLFADRPALKFSYCRVWKKNIAECHLRIASENTVSVWRRVQWENAGVRWAKMGDEALTSSLFHAEKLLTCWGGKNIAVEGLKSASPLVLLLFLFSHSIWIQMPGEMIDSKAHNNRPAAAHTFSPGWFLYEVEGPAFKSAPGSAFSLITFKTAEM